VAELDQDYIRKMEDVLAVYEKPYDPAEPVICLDEKPITLHAEARPAVRAKPGKAGKRDNEYVRHGVANVFGVVEPKAGRHFTAATPNRSGVEFARLIDHVAAQYPFARAIHLVMDNLSTHSRKSLTDCFGEQEGSYLWDRFVVHHTPKHGSWLNQAEIELSVFSRQCLGKRRIADYRLLKKETAAWRNQANRSRTTIRWQFTRRKARKLFRYTKPPHCQKLL
jgi:hypothetical protein